MDEGRVDIPEKFPWKSLVSDGKLANSPLTSMCAGMERGMSNEVLMSQLESVGKTVDHSDVILL